jgi:hypothetical protein
MKIGLSLLLPFLASAVMLSQTPEAPRPSSNSSGEGTASAASPPKTSILPELERLEAAASQVSLEIGRLRVDKWKAGSAKSAAQTNADSVQRNLTSALPGLIGAVRAAPEDLNAEFKLYRNLNALCDVVSSLTDATRAFGPNSDYEALAQQSQVLDSIRRKLGDSLEQQTATTQQELNHLRVQTKVQQEQLAAAAAAPPKQIVVAQTEPPKKAAPKKKTVAKKPATAGSSSNSNSSGSNSNGQKGVGTTFPKS